MIPYGSLAFVFADHIGVVVVDAADLILSISARVSRVEYL